MIPEESHHPFSKTDTTCLGVLRSRNIRLCRFLSEMSVFVNYEEKIHDITHWLNMHACIYIYIYTYIYIHIYMIIYLRHKPIQGFLNSDAELCSIPWCLMNSMLTKQSHCRWLTHWGRVTYICVGELTIIGSDNGLSRGRRQAISHYLNHCWNIVNWTLGHKPQWNFNPNSSIFIKENAFENVVCETASICLCLNVLRHHDAHVTSS